MPAWDEPQPADPTPIASMAAFVDDYCRARDGGAAALTLLPVLVAAWTAEWSARHYAICTSKRLYHVVGCQSPEPQALWEARRLLEGTQ